MSSFDDLPSLRELLAGVRAGDEESEDKLFNRYQYKFLKFTRRCLRLRNCGAPNEHCDDVSDDAWVRIVECLGQLKNDESFEWWAKKIILRLVADHAERCREEKRKFEELTQTPTHIYSKIIPADEVLISAEQIDIILDTAERYNEKLPRILTMHDLEGYKFDEIADEVNDTYDNVRNIYYRGLRELRRQLGKDYSQGDTESTDAPPATRDAENERNFADGNGEEDESDDSNGAVM